MPKNELLFTIAGLLATFMLPWPGETTRTDPRAEAAAERSTCSGEAKQQWVVRRGAQGEPGA